MTIDRDLLGDAILKASEYCQSYLECTVVGGINTPLHN